MKSQSHDFKAQSKQALADDDLQIALKQLGAGFVKNRRDSVDELPEFESLRNIARDICDHTLANLDFYLLQYEQKVQALGGTVHWAESCEQATEIIVRICKEANAKKIIRGKSMVGEEMGLNEVLDSEGFETIETDLGEYILQLACEPPSHIIAPAIHKTKDQVAALFKHYHNEQGSNKDVRTPSRTELVAEARKVLREAFLSADVGITGANFLVADTGSNILVTNEGNGDLTSTLPKTHIVTASIDKVVPTLEDVSVLLRLLGRSATGQEITAYTTVTTGPKRMEDVDGPASYHVVLLDNGRSKMLGNEFREMLRCIRCGACMNHCPVYSRIGGQAYGWVYPGPMGSVLTPLMLGEEAAIDLPNACTLNGSCQDVCPVKIPLPKLLRAHRTKQFDKKLNSKTSRFALACWAYVAKHPKLYHFAVNVFIRSLKICAGKRGVFHKLPLAGGWTSVRDMPVPQGRSFQSIWREKSRSES